MRSDDKGLTKIGTEKAQMWARDTGRVRRGDVAACARSRGSHNATRRNPWRTSTLAVWRKTRHRAGNGASWQGWVCRSMSRCLIRRMLR